MLSATIYPWLYLSSTNKPRSCSQSRRFTNASSLLSAQLAHCILFLSFSVPCSAPFLLAPILDSLLGHGKLPSSQPRFTTRYLFFDCVFTYIIGRLRYNPL
ncbi:hypothetical protein ARMSODRAFT_370925 [Armillaria solidipes]|uniref:Uncharacterized protein n=1 Tax=Armillaria solidipes TaxID=1076256 RepID=A0A2H3BNL5_9AGAR|nr:hypothetical protein ARMSODRAFT_370925 [Armillaria solidipes]